MILSRKLTFGSLLVGVWLVSGCQPDYNSRGVEYAPNMYEAVSYEPFRQNADFKNPINEYGNNLWYPVQGTVARRNYQTSFRPDSGAAIEDLMLYNIPKDSIGIAERVLKNPVPLNEQTLADGKELYTRYCLHCHGETGKGDGPVGKVYKGVPNYAGSGYKDMNSGHIYHVITHGKGRMWPHGSQMNPVERWKIVHYVHELQKQ
ncbi:MAG: cytochrome c [Cytophagales bacterium]|jgi:mono/diheme cytochrome c family protein|nr:cytochrome c [Cytophagales bacterium]